MAGTIWVMSPLKWKKCWEQVKYENKRKHKSLDQRVSMILSKCLTSYEQKANNLLTCLIECWEVIVNDSQREGQEGTAYTGNKSMK